MPRLSTSRFALASALALSTGFFFLGSGASPLAPSPPGVDAGSVAVAELAVRVEVRVEVRVRVRLEGCHRLLGRGRPGISDRRRRRARRRTLGRATTLLRRRLRGGRLRAGPRLLRLHPRPSLVARRSEALPPRGAKCPRGERVPGSG